jgi:hypothetical protein
VGQLYPLTLRPRESDERRKVVIVGRMQQLSVILKVLVSFFFKCAPQLAGKARWRETLAARGF